MQTVSISDDFYEIKFNSGFFFVANVTVNSWWQELTQTCRLMDVSTIEGQIRLTTEVLMEFGAILYILSALREASFLGGHMFIENLVRTLN